MPSWPSTASRSSTSWAVRTSGQAELTLRPPAAGSGFRPALGGTPGVRDLGVAASAVDGQLGRQRGGRQAGAGFQRREDARINGGNQEVSESGEDRLGPHKLIGARGGLVLIRSNLAGPPG